MLCIYHPADSPLEAFPLGNGRLGAMVFGGTHDETILLNEDTLWSGYPCDRSNPTAADYLEKVRQKILCGENLEAQELIEAHMLGEFSESYMPMGALRIHDLSDEPASGYIHQLSLQEATDRVYYKQGGACRARSSYVSHADDIFIMEYVTDIPGTLSFDVSLDSQLRSRVEVNAEDLLLFGQCPEHVEPNYEKDAANPIVYGSRGIRFCICVRVITEDGVVTTQPDGLRVENATRCYILCNGQNTYQHQQPEQICKQKLDAAVSQLTNAHARHTAAFSALYARTSLRLGKAPAGPYDMEALLQAARAGQDVLPLYEMLFAYGRYLAICSSRQGVPANLQGIWNWDLRPAWSGNWTTNINLQMNFWAAESCGLPELGEALALWLETVIPAGQQAAAEYYRADGWCMHHNVDLWGKMTPTMREARFGCWPLAGVWLCQHVYNHFRYSADPVFLMEHALPIMEGAVRFCLDWLMEDAEGRLITCPSTSPENTFYYGGDRQICSVGCSSASDIAMIAELFDNYTQGCRIAGYSSPLLGRVTKARRQMRWFNIQTDGTLCEWDKPYEEFDPGHRHFSNLYGCYPGELYLDDPSLMAASEKAFLKRIKHGGGIMGWSCIWAVALAARYRKPALCASLLSRFVRTAVTPNGFDFVLAGDEFPDTRNSEESAWSPDKFGWFQIDANLGFPAAIIEMLVQYHGQTLTLLPCLPEGWDDGALNGLRLPGDMTLDLCWADRCLHSAALYTGQNFDENVAICICTDSCTICRKIQRNRRYSLSYTKSHDALQLFSEENDHP